MRPSAPYLLRIGVVAILLLFAVPSALAQLNENCTVSMLNRTVQVTPDGSWLLPNVPANFGQVRARATCVQNGVTTSGESDFFVLSANGIVNLPEIVLGAATPIPGSLSITSGGMSLTTAGQTSQLAVTATYPDGSTMDVTAATAGTNYTTSNPATATVNEDGLVTAVTSGTVVVSAMSEGALGLISIQVILSGDADGDDIPDDVELANGLNPNNPVDALEDFDNDGLTNKEELVDFGTNFQVADTDGDNVNDADEIADGSNPTDPSSFNLERVLESIEVTPSIFEIVFNTIFGDASRQLTVTGTLRNGTSIDLTSTSTGTTYSSSDLTICNFGAQSGRIFAGADGSCTITVTNSGFSTDASGTVRTFAPTALSFVDIPGFANNVDVNGDFAYVAAGATGLQVVDVFDRSAPVVVGAVDTPGNANDVKVEGDTAFIADGSAGLQIVDITDPLNPQIIGDVDTPGTAQDVVVKGNFAYVADGAAGLQVVDISDLTAPSILGTVDTPGTAKGVDVQQESLLAVVADGATGVQVVDVTDPSNPTIIGSTATGDARDVVLNGDFVFVADFVSSFTVVDITDPANPTVRTSTPRETGGLLLDVAQAGRFAFGADVFFVNGVPIIEVSTPTAPLPVAILDFRNFRDDNGIGIAADSSYVYLTAGTGITENGTTGNTRLYIGQYLDLDDTAGISPNVEITAPMSGETVIEGSSLLMTAEATDDIAVAAVEFLVDGAVAFTDTAPPYQATVTVPVGVSSLVLGARAVDLGGNSGTAADVVLNVIPDPLTTVIGRVFDPDTNPVAGATVTCLHVSGLTGADGTFSIPDVPTVRGAVRCRATFVTPEGETLEGRAVSVLPVSGGTTDVGDIVVDQSAIYRQDWESGIEGWFSKHGPSDPVVLVQDASAPSPTTVHQVTRRDAAGNYFSPLIPLQGGQTYCVASWIRWVGGGWPFVGIDNFNASGAGLGENWLIGRSGVSTGFGDAVEPVPADTVDWHWYGKTFTLRSNATSVRLKTELWVSDGKEGANLGFFDNLAIFDGPCPTEPPF